MPLSVLLTFALVFGIIFAGYYLAVLKPEQEEQTSLRRRLKTNIGAVRNAVAGLRRQESRMSTIPVVHQILQAAGGITGPLQRLIDRSGLELTVAALLMMVLGAAALAYLAVLYISHFALAAAVIAVFCAYIPIWFLNFMAKRRLYKFEEQFPEAIDLMSRALKAGHAFTTGLSMVAEEMPDPVGTEFRLAYDRQNFGMPMPEALKSLGERVPLLDARFFVTAVLTQREAGGNLAEVLDNLAAVIRERFKVKRQIRVITAHARITGWVLALLPPSLGVALTLLSPEHMSLLWTDPTGIKMTVVALILQVVGTLIIRKLVDVEYDQMLQDPLTLALVLVFMAVAVLTGLVASIIAARTSPERRRLREMAAATGMSTVGLGSVSLTDQQGAMVRRVQTFVPKSPKEMGRLQKRMVRAGFKHPQRAAVLFAASEIVFPVLFALATVAYMGLVRGGMFALLAAGVGYALPGIWLARKIGQRQKQIQNGLPDALDLLIVCVEAGAGLDAAIVKASEELAIAYPALAEELQLVTTECRAGKPRVEAFKNFAQRTGVDDVRALVAMLVQTDRFGTSIAQALRTHAATSRTKRRQRAEERAAKLGVKLVFPLVFCLFPALYVVVLGPAVIKIMAALMH